MRDSGEIMMMIIIIIMMIMIIVIMIMDISSVLSRVSPRRLQNIED